MIPYQCPQCGATLQIQFAGQSGTCSKCGHKFIAPALAPPPMPFESPPPKSGNHVVVVLAAVAVTFVGAIFLFAIVAAIAIPNLLRAPVMANESAAIGAMRTIASGEAAFQSARVLDADQDGVGEYGTLADMGDATPPYIDPILAAGQKQGYTFVCTPLPDGEEGFVCRADPITPGKTGNRHFFVDETGVITFNPSSPASADDNPV